jgi:hypothetical protein
LSSEFESRKAKYLPMISKYQEMVFGLRFMASRLNLYSSSKLARDIRQVFGVLISPVIFVATMTKQKSGETILKEFFSVSLPRFCALLWGELGYQLYSIVDFILIHNYMAVKIAVQTILTRLTI